MDISTVWLFEITNVIDSLPRFTLLKLEVPKNKTPFCISSSISFGKVTSQESRIAQEIPGIWSLGRKFPVCAVQIRINFHCCMARLKIETVTTNQHIATAIT